MAQIIPSITSLPSDSGAAPSVEDIQDHLPSICVDYLSHNWTEEDVWASWRNMTRHKHEIANGVRLENASWRTWNKQRNKLRTISPETLNWLKDSDVTWLYGPLHTAKVQPVRPLKISSTADRVGIDLPNKNGKPGILKHRTLSELLSLPGPTSPDLDDTDAIDEDDFVVAGPVRAGLSHTKSETNLLRSNSMPARRRAVGLGRSGSVRAASGNNSRSKEVSPENNNRRKITFNTFVEQCVALDEPNLSQVVVDDSDDDEIIEMRSSLSRFSSGRRSSSVSSTLSQASMTIKMIAPTVLKTAGSYANNPSVPQTVHRPPLAYMPQEENTAPTIITPSFGSQSPLGQVGSRPWHIDDDQYGSPKLDYFVGPDLTGTSPPYRHIWSRPGCPDSACAAQVAPGADHRRSPRQHVIVVVVFVSQHRNPARRVLASASEQGGILKVRTAPSASQQVSEPISPPAIFNYNPSVATGIGGMYGSYENAQLAIGTAATASEERSHRGRSAQRGYGSSKYDRSVPPRGSSTSSASSVGSVSRSPVDGGNSETASRPQQVDNAQHHEPMDVDASPERSSTPTPSLIAAVVDRPEPVGERPNFIDSPASVSPKATLGDVRGELSQPSDGDDDDGSTLIGRATNIANTAKDLLGALWYGSQDEAARARPAAQQHRRGASLG
ncbi:hypothetical protein CcaverHIS002_0703260 [Cutaneotrichosporon cavernicola]|nr:hypothetical protein CcaverHIS002_0703260 [Cutaneotrichosporon cavernicola]